MGPRLRFPDPGTVAAMIGGMESIVARVVEALVADVIDAVRAHESYHALVKTLSEQALAGAAQQAIAAPAASSTSTSSSPSSSTVSLNG